MNVQLDNVSSTRKNLLVTLDPGEVDAEHRAIVGEIGKIARIPGFRPGKAPAAMVAKRFGKEIADEFRRKVVAKAYREGLDKEKLDVLNVVKIDEGTIKPGEAANVTITVDIRPDFQLPDYVGLPTEVVPVEATATEVENVIQALRAERADFKTAERPAQKGDFVRLGYEGTIDGKPIAEIVPDKQLYGKVPQTWEEVEATSEGPLPGLSRQLAGVKAGDKKEVLIVFPANFDAAPSLSGKAARYAVDIQEVRERTLPELDEQFLKSRNVENISALEEKIRSNLRYQKEQQNRAAQRRQVTEQLAMRIDLPVPDSLVESETQNVLRNFIEEHMQRGVPAEQFEKDKRELYDGAKKAATNRVKIQILLARVAEMEKIAMDEADLNRFLHQEASRSGQKPEKIAKTLENAPDRLRAVQQSIIFDKAVDFLVSKAKVSTLPPKT